MIGEESKNNSQTSEEKRLLRVHVEGYWRVGEDVHTHIHTNLVKERVHLAGSNRLRNLADKLPRGAEGKESTATQRKRDNKQILAAVPHSSETKKNGEGETTIRNEKPERLGAQQRER